MTATGSVIIGSASMTEADLEKIYGNTNGTVSANKAVVVDGKIDQVIILDGGLQYQQDKINIKGKTTDNIGMIGSKEASACQTIISLSNA